MKYEITIKTDKGTYRIVDEETIKDIIGMISYKEGKFYTDVCKKVK